MEIPDTFWVGFVFASSIWTLCLVVFTIGIKWNDK